MLCHTGLDIAEPSFFFVLVERVVSHRVALLQCSGLREATRPFTCGPRRLSKGGTRGMRVVLGDP